MCRCDCGNETHVRAYWLNKGRTKSCGCYRRTFKVLPNGESALRIFLAQYVANAKTKGLEFALSRNEFRNLTGRDCHYCGAPPKPLLSWNGKRSSGTPYLGNGLDRVDNLVGYSVANCVPCCSTCNYMKRGWDRAEFLAHVRRIAEHAD